MTIKEQFRAFLCKKDEVVTSKVWWLKIFTVLSPLQRLLKRFTGRNENKNDETPGNPSPWSRVSPLAFKSSIFLLKWCLRLLKSKPWQWTIKICKQSLSKVLLNATFELPRRWIASPGSWKLLVSASPWLRTERLIVYSSTRNPFFWSASR